MNILCHRCGNSLVEDEPYCPHCGAPQLRVEAGEAADLPKSAADPAHAAVQDLIRWRAAVTSALWTALPVAVVSSLLDFAIFWVLAGGFLTVAMYRRRAAASTTGRIGWRLGALTGFIAAFLWAALHGGILVVERYGLHHGASLNEQLRATVQQSLQMVAQQRPEFASQFPWISRFWLSPDGMTAIVLAGVAMVAVNMVLFSAAGGALGGRYLAARARNRPVL